MPLGAWEFYTVLDDDLAAEEASTGTCCARGSEAAPRLAVPAAPRAPDMATRTAVLDDTGLHASPPGAEPEGPRSPRSR